MAKVLQEIPAEWKATRNGPGTTPGDGWRKFADGQIYALDASDYEGKAPAQHAKAERWAVWAGYRIVQWARSGDTIAVQFEKLSDEDAGKQRVEAAAALKAAKEKRAAEKAAEEAKKATETSAETPAVSEGTPAPVDPFAATTAD